MGYKRGCGQVGNASSEEGKAVTETQLQIKPKDPGSDKQKPGGQ